MPEKRTLQRAKRDKQEGKASTTQAGEFIREEFHHIRHGKHGARSPQQAIAIGLSKARRPGVELKPPAPGEQSESTRHKGSKAQRSAAAKSAAHTKGSRGRRAAARKAARTRAARARA